MKFNKWTLGLAAVGAVSLASAARADETMSPVQTALSSTTISGYLDFTASWKPGTGNINMPGRVYDGGYPGYAQDGFNLNVVSITLDKPLDEGTWSSGYHVQLLTGPGAAKRGTGVFGGTELAFNEAYIALRVPVGNGIDLKVGQFGTYNGYEAYDTYKNPNWSRSYGFFNETSAHTGISASYKICDAVSVMAGIGNTGLFNSQVNALSASESSKAYLAMVTLTAPESFGFLKGATLTGGYTTGPAAGGPPTSPHMDNFYAGASIPLPVTGLALGLAYDYTSDVPTFGGASGQYANATAVYVTYAMDKWTFANRLDYTSATSGWYYGAPGLNTDQLVSETFTVGYSLWKNVITRVEARWDHTLSAGRPFGGTVVAPAPNEKNALSLALNVIYQF